MKNQLLEDIGDAHPALPPRSRSSAAPSRPAPGSAARPQVWRGRRSPAGQTAQPLPPAPPPDLTVRSPEPPPDLFSFASQQPDLSIQLPEEPVPWMERWGRKAFGWTLAAVAVAGLAGAGLWLYGDTQVESTLALVADQTPPAAPAPPPATPSAPRSASLSPPPATIPAAPAPEPAPPASLEAGETLETPAAVAAAPVVAAAAPAVKKEAKKEKTPTPVARKPAQKTRPVRTAARRETPRTSRPERPSPRAAPPAVARAQLPSPQPPARADTPPADDALAETLRQCRAAGYHATLCIKRGCSATKFGLACRG